jgi:hypothetical protein
MPRTVNGKRIMVSASDAGITGYAQERMMLYPSFTPNTKLSQRPEC